MAMTRGSTILLDTNVFLSATDQSREHHQVCTDLLRTGPYAGVHFVTIGQVLREYLVVATRPADVNGLGLGVDAAVRNIGTFRTRMHILPETREILDELISVTHRHSLKGKRIHDANLVAAVHHHHVDHIVTDNISDYASLTLVPVWSPSAAVEGLRGLM